MQGVLLALHDRILNVEGCDNRYKLGACDSRNEELPRASDEHIVPKGKSSLNCKNAADREAEAAGAEEKSAPRPLATPADKGETFRDVTKVSWAPVIGAARHRREGNAENTRIDYPRLILERDIIRVDK